MGAKPPWIQDVEENLSVDHWHVPARDNKGHYERRWFNLMPAMALVVTKILSSRVFPYKTPGSFLRHAVIRHIHWLARRQELDGQIKSTVQQVEAIMDIMRDSDFSFDFTTLFEKMQEQITKYVSRNDMGQAKHMLLRIRNHVNKMPDGYWKDRYLKEINDRFDHVLKYDNEDMSVSMGSFSNEK